MVSNYIGLNNDRGERIFIKIISGRKLFTNSTIYIE
jgi:hypothetical protein